MEQEIKVSVICSVYNHGKYVRDTLEGFVSQKTQFPFEVLVHDDASTDNSADIIREYEAKYPDIIKPIYQTENQYSQGVKINRVFQSPRVKGKYVALCEGDDYWTDPLKLQKQYTFLEEHPEYSMCTSSTVWLDMRTGETANKCRTSEDRDVTLEEIILEEKGRVFQYATILVKSELYKDLPEWVQRFRVGDTPLAIYAATRGKIRMLADTMAVYRNHAEGSWTARMDNVEQRKKMIGHMIEGLIAFNEATGYRYNDVVSFRIKRNKYNLARLNRDFKAIRSQELREVYRSRSFAARVSDMLQCKAPSIYAFVKKILHK